MLFANGRHSLSAAGTVVLAALVLTAPLSAEEKTTDNPAAKPLDRLDNNKGWKERHEKLVAQAKKGHIDIVFLGDSITQGWEGSPVWRTTFEPLKAANFGVGGDQTGHVLWRITEGKELEGLTPKVTVLLIGTNNMAEHSAEQIAGGVQAIVTELWKQKPEMNILVLGIFPRSPRATDKIRGKINTCNALLAKLEDGKKVVYLDIGAKFLEKDGSLSRTIMLDFTHPSQKGCEIWAEAIRPTLEKMLK